MTWNNSKRNHKKDIEILAEKISQGKSVSRLHPVQGLIDKIGIQDTAELIMMIYNQVMHHDKDKEWIQKALDRQEKLESRNWNAGRPNKVEKYVESIRNAYQNPEIDDDYWKNIWKEAQEECGRTTQYRIRKKLKEEHDLKIDEPHGNAEQYDYDTTMVEM
jgi:hypothetical protein